MGGWQEGAGLNLLSLIFLICKMGGQNTCPTQGYCEDYEQDDIVLALSLTHTRCSTQ